MGSESEAKEFFSDNSSMSSYAESLAPKAGFRKISEQAEIRSSLPLICTFAGTTCSTPTSIEHANIQVKSYNENSRERYICNSGFKRKAGTSSLTKCLRNEDTNITQWTIPTLVCISKYLPLHHPSLPPLPRTHRQQCCNVGHRIAHLRGQEICVEV